MKRLMKLVIGVVIIGLIAGVGLWWYLRKSAPAKVSLDNAVAAVSTSSGNAGAANNGSIDGVWKVNTTKGSFDFHHATGTFVGFRINENLVGVGKTEAVGRTGDVTGSLTISGNQATAAAFTAQVRSIKTDIPMRDGQVYRALDSSQFPTLTFKLTQPIALGSAATSGVALKTNAIGELTLRGQTRLVSVAIQAKRVGQTIVVVGSTGIKLADFGIPKPFSPRVVSLEDHGTMEFQLLLTR